MIILKALSALLTYPSEPLLEAAHEIATVVDGDSRLSRKDKQALAALIEELSTSDPLDAQERYVDLFDRGRKTSLHLFEHVHGESRDRGQAMVDLQQVYARAGYRLSSNELPDFVPAMLEFLSLRPEPEVREMLSDCAHILRAIGATLQERDSHYGAVFGALLTIAGESGLRAGQPSGPVEDEKSLDEEWAEEPVIFGPAAAASCGGSKPQVSVMQFVPRRQR
jgi:nitrate reductase delta subunit